METQIKTKNFGAYIDRTIKVIKQNYLQAFKEIDVDLTTEQWVILDSLYQENGVSQTDLASGSFKNAPTVSRIIDLLCKKGLTERQRFENDRRRHKIFLTQKGKMTYEKAYPIVVGLREKGWQNLSDEDYGHFLRIMNQIFQNFEVKE
ncbi:MAG: MarR family transcriptional regulator [Bacteroidetes bacterium]|jgi:DNA-binding MarR family transcriptional regulator|nr:MarR family transcriptional regulator [Bacteroidota bacterium]